MTGVKTFWCEFIAGLNAPSKIPIHIDSSNKPEVNLLYYAPHLKSLHVFFYTYFIWRHLFRETSQTIFLPSFFIYFFVCLFACFTCYWLYVCTCYYLLLWLDYILLLVTEILCFFFYWLKSSYCFNSSKKLKNSKWKTLKKTTVLLLFK